jgi:hypothetical protein
VVIRGFSFANVADVDAQLTGFISAAQIRRQLDVQVGGSTTSRQTATAADTLEIDVPPRHEGNARGAVGDGHGAILPWMATKVATRSNFSSQ